MSSRNDHKRVISTYRSSLEIQREVNRVGVKAIRSDSMNSPPPSASSLFSSGSIVGVIDLSGLFAAGSFEVPTTKGQRGGLG